MLVCVSVCAGVCIGGMSIRLCWVYVSVGVCIGRVLVCVFVLGWGAMWRLTFRELP